MRSVQTQGCTQVPTGRGFSGRFSLRVAGSDKRHWGRFGFPVSVHSTSTFLHPFAPPALPGFIATMSALTPVRSALRIQYGMMNAVLCSAQVSLVRVSSLPSILSPTTQHPPAVALTHIPSARRACCGPLPAHTSFSMHDRRLWTSPTGCRLARMPGRIEFVILRTARLPPVLPTPPRGNAVAFSSRPEYAYLERTCTSDQTRSQTVHPTRLVRVVKEIENPEPKPAGNLIHHPGKLDGVFTGNRRFLWPAISFTIQASWMESPLCGATITFGDYCPVDQDCWV